MKTHTYTEKQQSTNYTRGTDSCFIHAVTSDIGNCVGVDTKGRWHYKQQLSSGQWWQLGQFEGMLGSLHHVMAKVFCNTWLVL